ncbi:hypothetical protein [Parasphingorhabdus pacifica]
MVALSVIVAMVCGTAWWAHSEYTRARDQRHFYALTKHSPWPWRDLLIPDGLPTDDGTRSYPRPSMTSD